MKHTPGPWMVWTEEGFEIFPSPQGMRIAIVHKESDAALIAAAPDLLNAVRFLLSNPFNKITQADVSAAYAAIKKATGE